MAKNKNDLSKKQLTLILRTVSNRYTYLLTNPNVSDETLMEFVELIRALSALIKS